MKTLIKDELREDCERFFPRGSTVYTILRHVSSSGMTRVISLVTIDKDGVVLHPNYSAAKFLKMRLTTKHGSDGIVVTGCGMDMGFHLVHNLSSALYGKNADGSYNKEGAYSLKQVWL